MDQLRAFVDESSDQDHFVMAGYIATDEVWAELSSDWNHLLGLGPPHWRRLTEVRMSSMTSPLGLEQSELFYRLIERHLGVFIMCTIRFDDLKKAQQADAWLTNEPFVAELATDPYFHAVLGIHRAAQAAAAWMGSAHPLKLVFDEHSKQGGIQRTWRRVQALPRPASFAPWAGTPAFERSAGCPALQAADMLAYWSRVAASRERASGQIGPSFPWPLKKTDFVCFGLQKTVDDFKWEFRRTFMLSLLTSNGVPIEDAATFVLKT